jgi:hypothetical protein
MKPKQFKAGWGKKMPSTSKKQHNFMAAIAKNPAFAKKVGIKPSVGEHFMKADKGRKFGKGGEAHAEKGEMKKDLAQDKKMIKKAFAMHDKQEHKGGKGTNLAALKRGGKACGMAMGGQARAMSKGEHSVQKRAKQGAEMIKMAKGGLAAGHKSADGIASKGKTKGKEITMCGGGYMKKGK